MFLQVFEVFGCDRTCLDTFGPVGMCSDTFGCVSMRSDAFGCDWQFSENFRKFEILLMKFGCFGRFFGRKELSTPRVKY